MPADLAPDQWKLVNDLFHQAVEMPTEHRLAFIEAETRNDERVKQEILSLLHSYSQAGRFLESSIAKPFSFGAVPDASLESGTRIGDFVILKTAGRGAFAVVYLAHQLSLDRQVALKVSCNFGEEARTMASLEHDNIVTVFSESVDTEKDLRLLCMQYIPGTTLEKVLAGLNLVQKPITERDGGAVLLQLIRDLTNQEAAFATTSLPNRERLDELDFSEAILWLGAQLADALAYAHERSVLHLDVKPGNVLVTLHGRPLLSDFNISVQRDEDGTASHILGGTLNYMAPEHRVLFEQAKHPSASLTKAPVAVDPRADIFSLGVVLKEMAEKGETNSPTARALTQILKRCTEYLPSKRYPSATSLRDTLEGCLELSSIYRALPSAGYLTDLVERYPAITFSALTLVPQAIGTMVNISYNEIMIVRHLTPAQQTVFLASVPLYNAIAWPLCVALFIRSIFPLLQHFQEDRQAFDDVAEPLPKLRELALQIPRRLAGFITLGWLPGGLIFPLAIHLVRGPVSPAVFGHFLLSFILSWLIALSYSCLNVQYVVTRVVYPLLWSREAHIRRTAKEELARRNIPIGFLQFMAGFVPLIAAALVVLIGSENLSHREYRIFQGLVIGLLGFGMIGLIFSLRTAQLLSRTLFAFTGESHSTA